jgi:hypothetical protein
MVCTTRRWRQVDSNFQFRAKQATVAQSTGRMAYPERALHGAESGHSQIIRRGLRVARGGSEA